MSSRALLSNGARTPQCCRSNAMRVRGGLKDQFRYPRTSSRLEQPNGNVYAPRRNPLGWAMREWPGRRDAPGQIRTWKATDRIPTKARQQSAMDPCLIARDSRSSFPDTSLLGARGGARTGNTVRDLSSLLSRFQPSMLIPSLKRLNGMTPEREGWLPVHAQASGTCARPGSSCSAAPRSAPAA